MWMLLGSVLYSVIGPFLYLTGLASTDVPTAAIIQRMESLNFLFLAYFALGAPITPWTFFSAALTFCGIVLAVISPVFFDDTIKISTGSLFILLSGYAFSCSLIISKKYLTDIPVAVLAVFRVSLGQLSIL
jgi:drug/metabolite transporter (DMT)-like permease